MVRRWLAGATVITTALTVALSGCSGSGAGTAATTPAPASPAPAATATPAAACLTDPQAVIDRPLPESATAPMPAATSDALDKAATEGLAQTAAAGAVVAVRSPEGTFTKAYGVADRTSNTPMTAEMHQRIGSLTTAYTGAVVLRFAQDGLISLDDPISSHLQGVPRGEDITIRMLLNMTSGIASYTDDPEFQKVVRTQPAAHLAPEELLAIGLDMPRPFEPGAQYGFSYTNTILLGQLIEGVTAGTYDAALKTIITDPLKLANTSMPNEEGTLATPHATGLTLQRLPEGQTEPQNATDWNPSWAWSGGALTSTAADLLPFGRALATGQGVLDAKTQTERLTFPQEGGYGLAVGCHDGWVGQAGDIPGFTTTLFHDTRSDTTVAVLTNSDIASGDCTTSPTLPDTPKGIPCMDPATRIFTAVSQSLGHQFTPVPKS